MKQYTYEIYYPCFPNTEVKWRVHRGLIKDNRDKFHPTMIQCGEFKRIDMDAAKKEAKSWYDHYMEGRGKRL